MDFNKLVEVARKASITEIEVYKVTKNGLEIETFNGEIDKNVTFATTVMAIRGVYNKQIATVYVEHDSDENIDFIVERIKDNASLLTIDEPYFIFEGSKEYPSLLPHTYDLDEYSVANKIDLCLSLEKKMKDLSQYVDKTEASYSEVSYVYEIINTNGLNVRKNGRYAQLFGELICQRDNEVKQGYDYQTKRNIRDFSLDEIAKKAVDKAISTFGALPVKSDIYPVVLENSVMASLLKAYAPLFSAENVLKKMSFLGSEIDNQVFGKNITIIDDPLNTEAINQDSFDDEGVATMTKTVVDKGVLKTFLHNLKTAKMMNTSSTANAAKESVASSVVVSPSNLYLEKGEQTFDEMIKPISKGVFINSIMGQHAGINTISGNFSLQASGFVIENGELKAPVTLIIISGNIKDLLNDVGQIANDFKFFGNIGASSVLINKLNISGK